MKKWLPILIVAAMAAWFVSTLRPPQDKTFAFSQFGKLPVVFNGRVQPMDSLARNSLLQIREKQEANLEPWKGMSAHLIPATEWLASVMMDPATADQWPVFRVDNPDLIALLKLPAKDLAQHQDGKHYSWAQIQPALHALDDETTRIMKESKEASARTAYEKAAVKMREKLWLYLQLKNTMEPEDTDLKSEVAKLQSVYPAERESLGAFNEALDGYFKLRSMKGQRTSQAAMDQQTTLTQDAVDKFLAVAKTTQAGKPYTRDDLATVFEEVEHLSSMASLGGPLLIPPREAGLAHDSWRDVGTTLMENLRQGQTDPSVTAYAALSGAFRSTDASEFNRQLVLYRSSLAASFSPELSKAGWEVFFNRMQPFYNAMLVYVLALILAFCFWLTFSETVRRVALWLVVWALVIHTTGLIFRMALEGRPPVTNLYSSAIFIGWGACVLGLVLELFWKNAIGLVVACVIGFITLIIAHFLALSGDTMEMMRAVLDTNIWLATHVVIVTLGYASTFVAGFLGVLYIVLGYFTPLLARQTGKPDIGKSLTKMIYGIVCFATLFSFVGTVLGGIWADQSWGRFWGWDPKENGALIIVLWNALILHLRWGGMIRERGLATAAVIGNIVTSWSWFGVNMLGIGLHSYGFMDSAFYWLLAFVASQLALIGIGSMPLRKWKSFKGTIPPAGPESGEGTRGTSPAAA
jgi:ABC-type transport system involved in cytochrome c biogenesis permease subunit